MRCDVHRVKALGDTIGLPALCLMRLRCLILLLCLSLVVWFVLVQVSALRVS